MIKILLILIIAVLVMAILAVPVAAFAADNDVDTAALSEFFTWGLLATYAGCLAATLLFTQLTKGLWPPKWPTQILSYIIAYGTLILANWVLNKLSWDSALISVFNAGLVSLAANGGYDTIREIADNKNTT